MRRDIVTVPRELMLQSKFDWDIDWRGRSSNETNAGFIQTVYNALPRWYGKPELSVLAQDIPAWRALRATARGRKNIFRVPIIDGLTVSRSLWDRFSDGVTLSTGNRLGGGIRFEYVPSMAVAEVDEETGQLVNSGGVVPAGSEYITVVDDSNVGYAPKIGAIHSINDLPFIVTEVRELPPLGDAPAYRIRIEMPTRKPLNLMVEVDGQTTYSQDRMEILPYGLFVLEEESSGSITYGPQYKSSISFSFVEWLR